MYVRSRPSPAFRRAWLFLCFVIATASRLAGAEASEAVAVDRTIALMAGRLQVSRYLVDKNYQRFAADYRARFRREPGVSDTERWFRLYVAQTSLSARLAETGYLTRPAVQSAVTHMAREVLTQFDGLLYRTLYPPPRSAEALRALYESSARLLDAAIVRFDEPELARRFLAARPSGTDYRRILAGMTPIGAAPAYDETDGPTSWPCGAYADVADAVLQAKPGSWVGPVEAKLGTYVFFVRGETTRAVPPFAQAGADWEAFVRQVDMSVVHRARRRELLRESAFAADDAALVALLPRLAAGRVVGDTLSTAALFPSPRTLATYLAGGEGRSITDRDFVASFNQRFVRTVPQDVAALRTALQDIAVADCDYRDAIAAGLDRQPQFLEDRRNFALRQALAVYESEVLEPQLAITPRAVADHFARHQDRYRLPLEAKGTLYLFGTVALAGQARMNLSRGDMAGARALASKVQDLVVHRSGDSALGAIPNPAVLAMPDGQALGPFPYAGQPAVFVKASTGAPATPPLAEIETLVRDDLRREQLDRLELRFFEQTADAPRVHVNIDFAKYGLRTLSGL